MRSVAFCLAFFAAVPTLAQEGEDFVGFGFYFMPDREGASIITAVAPWSTAETAGMRAGDRILTVGGVPLPPFNEGDLLEAARDSLPAAFTVSRGADTLAVSLDVGPYQLTPLLRRMNAYLCLAGDCWDGIGLRVQPNGDWYEGQFDQGIRHGPGKMVLADGRIYSGQFANGLFHGRGVYRWPDATYWVGTFAYGAPEPPGVYTDENGDSRPGLPD